MQLREIGKGIRRACNPLKRLPDQWLNALCYLAPVFMFGGALLICRGIPGGPNSTNAVWHLPILSLAEQQWALGILPLWSSKLSLGYPVLAAEACILFHPLSWIAGHQPIEIIRLVALGNVLAAYFSFIAFSRNRGYRGLLPLIGACAYVGNGYTISQIFDGNTAASAGIAALPLALILGIGLNRRGVCRSLAGIFVLSWWLLIAGGIQVWAIVVMTTVIISSQYERPTVDPARVMWFVWAPLALALSTLAAATIMLPTVELWLGSSAARQFASVPGSFPFTGLVGVLVPQLFGPGTGVPYWNDGNPADVVFYASLLILLPIVAWPVASSMDRRRIRKGILGLLGVLLLACVGHVYTLHGMTPSLLAIPAVMAAGWLIMLSSRIVMDKFPEINRGGIRVFAYSAFGFLLLMIIMSLFLLSPESWTGVFRWFYESSYAAGIGTLADPINAHRLILLRLARQAVFCVLYALIWLVGARGLRRGFSYFLLLLCLADLLCFNQSCQWTPIVDVLSQPKVVFDYAKGHPDTIIALPGQYGRRNSPLFTNTATAMGDEPRQLTNVSSAFALNPLLTPGADNRLRESAYTDYVAMAGVTHVYFPVSRQQELQRYSVFAAASGTDGVLAAIPNPADSLFAVNRMLVVDGHDAILSKTCLQSFDWKSVAFVPTSEGIRVPPSPAPELSFKYTIVSRDEHSAVLRANSSTAALIVFTTPYFPGWIVYVNHKRVPIVEANGWMMAVPVPEGNLFIEMKYSPFSFRLGIYLSLLFMALTLLIVTARGAAMRLWRIKAQL